MGTRNDIFECRECNLALCIETCFEIYHTRRTFTAENNNSGDDDGSSSSYIEEETEEKFIETD